MNQVVHGIAREKKIIKDIQIENAVFECFSKSISNYSTEIDGGEKKRMKNLTHRAAKACMLNALTAYIMVCCVEPTVCNSQAHGKYSMTTIGTDKTKSERTQEKLTKHSHLTTITTISN